LRFDLILANPPYIGGAPGRLYSDGGGALGVDAALSWTRASVARLKPGGRMLLYSGAPVVQDGDLLRASLQSLCDAQACTLAYREIDPDVFPATLLHRAYWGVERIAAVGAVITRST